MDHVRIETDVLHDVDLAAVGPAAVYPSGRKHPDPRPRAAARRQFRFHFDAAVSPVAFALRDESRRSVFVTFPRIAARFDDEQTVFYARVLRATFGVELQLFVAPAVTADVVTPLLRVGQTVVVELVAPDQSPALLAGFARL